MDVLVHVLAATPLDTREASNSCRHFSTGQVSGIDAGSCMFLAPTLEKVEDSGMTMRVN